MERSQDRYDQGILRSRLRLSRRRAGENRTPVSDSKTKIHMTVFIYLFNLI